MIKSKNWTLQMIKHSILKQIGKGPAGNINVWLNKVAITGIAVIILTIFSFNAGADFNIDPIHLEHPYILFNKAEIPGLLKRTQTPPYKYIWDNLISRSPEKTSGTVNALIYAITGDEERGLQAREELFAVVDDLPYEGGQSPKLNISGPIGSAGLIYDMIYDLLTPDERLDLSDKMARNGIAPLYNHTWDAWWSKRRQHNYSPVFNAAYGIAAAAILKENPDAITWIERAAMRVQLFLHSQDPAGGFGEGVNYWCMSMRSIFPFMDGLRNLFNIDLYNNPYITDNTGLFVLYNLSPDRRSTLNFNDAGIDRKYDHHLMTRMAKIYPQFAWVVANDIVNLPEGKWETKQWPDKQPVGFGLSDMYSFLWYDAQAVTAPLDELQRSCFFPGIGWTVMRSGWDKNALQFGIISAPKFFGNHEHADRGSIILNAYGERLIIDAGKPFTYDDPIIENWFRGSAGHNLLNVNGEGQTSRENLSAPGHMSRFVSSPSFDYVLTENAGAYNGRVSRWDRHAIFAVPEFVILFDQVELPQPGELEFRYLSPGSCEIILKEDNTSLFPGDNAGSIPGGSSGRYNSENLYGSNFTETDWWKTGLPLPEMTKWSDNEDQTTDLLLKSFFIANPQDNGGEVNSKQEVCSGYQDYRLPATYLTQSYPNVRKANLITVLYPRSADMKKQKKLPQITDLSGNSSIGLKIIRDQKQHLIVGYGETAPFNYGSTGDLIRKNVSVEKLSSNADFASAVFDSIGYLSGYIMIHGTEMIVEDDTTEEHGQVTALHADFPLLAIADFEDNKVQIVFEVFAASGADLRINLPATPEAVSLNGRPIFVNITPFDNQGRKTNVAEFHIPSGRSNVTISYEKGYSLHSSGGGT